MPILSGHRVGGVPAVLAADHSATPRVAVVVVAAEAVDFLVVVLPSEICWGEFMIAFTVTFKVAAQADQVADFLAVPAAVLTDQAADFLAVPVADQLEVITQVEAQAEVIQISTIAVPLQSVVATTAVGRLVERP